MRLQKIVLATLLAVSLGACATSPPHRHRGPALVDVVVRPPAPRVVAVPTPRGGYVWAPGYWRWNGREHVWVDGRWLRERRGWHWVGAHWESRGDRWHLEEGHWQR